MLTEAWEPLYHHINGVRCTVMKPAYWKQNYSNIFASTPLFHGIAIRFPLNLWSVRYTLEIAMQDYGRAKYIHGAIGNVECLEEYWLCYTMCQTPGLLWAIWHTWPLPPQDIWSRGKDRDTVNIWKYYIWSPHSVRRCEGTLKGTMDESPLLG